MVDSPDLVRILVVAQVHDAKPDLMVALWGDGYQPVAMVSSELSARLQTTPPWHLSIVCDPHDADNLTPLLRRAAPSKPILQLGDSITAILTQIRQRHPPIGQLVFSGALVDLGSCTAQRDDGDVRVTPIEVRLLRFLAAHAEQVVGHDELLHKVWGYRDGVKSRTVTATLHRLRRKVEADPANPVNLRSVYGHGYTYVPMHAANKSSATQNDEDIKAEAFVPAPRDPFVGRSRELDHLRALTPHQRIITLWGPPGSGKTRLAIEMAHQFLKDFPGGMWFIDLARAQCTSDIVNATTLALSLAPNRNQSLDHIGRYLQRRQRSLLILDNCEGVTPHLSELVGRWLDRARELHIVATSREPLRVRGEHLVLVNPLDVPADSSPDSLASSSAAALFLTRAGAANPALDFRAEYNARHVASITRALDGLPLALELAAGRCRAMSLAQLEGRLGAQLDELTTDDRDRPDRHRTLRATLDWSWSLLDSAQQRALTSLALFEGGAFVEAAEAVAGSRETIEALVDKALIRPNADLHTGKMRISLLQTIKSYALEKLQHNAHAMGIDRAKAERAHALAVLPEHEIIWGQDDGTILAELSTDLDNVLAAARRAGKRADWGLAVYAAETVQSVVRIRGPRGVDLKLAQELLQEPIDDPLHRAPLDLIAGLGCLELERYEDAEQLLQQAADGAARAELTLVERRALNHLANLALRRRRIDEAQHFFKRSAQLSGDGAAIVVNLMLGSNGPRPRPPPGT